MKLTLAILFSASLLLADDASKPQPKPVDSGITNDFLKLVTDALSAQVQWERSLTQEQRNLQAQMNVGEQRGQTIINTARQWCSGQGLLLDEAKLQQRVLYCSEKPKEPEKK